MGYKQEQYRINAVINSMEITVIQKAITVMLRTCSENALKTRSKFEGVFEFVG